MTTEQVHQHPYIDPDPELGASPHLSEYLGVVTRRLWLVLIIFTVTTASSIWAVSKRQTYYSASAAIQVNDPQSQAAGLINIPRMGSVNLFVDPIQSEIQVLNSLAVREQVVDSLGLRLVRGDGGIRSELFRDIWVAPEAENGSFRMLYNSDGNNVQVFLPDGTPLGEAAVGEILDLGFMRFRPQPMPLEASSPGFDLMIIDSRGAAGEIMLSAEPRPETNIVDIGLVTADPVYTPLMLNAAALALRSLGAERVRSQAVSDRTFIQQTLEQRQRELDLAQAAIRQFKTDQAFTSLPMSDQQLFNRFESVQNRLQAEERQRIVLVSLIEGIDASGVANVDLVSILTELPERTNAQLRAVITRVQAKKAEESRLVNEQRLSAGHPQIQAVRGDLNLLQDDLEEAARASLRVVENNIAQLEAEETEINERRAEFPELEATLTELEGEVELALQSHQLVLQNLFQVQISESAAAPYIEVIDPAAGAYAMQDRGQVNLILGAFLGLILGVGAAFFLEYLDRTVRTSSDVESLLGIPVLGVIPRLRRLDPGSAGQLAGRGVPLVVAMDPLDPAAEAYRNLRMNLMFMSSDEEPIRTILFSSPGPSEGKSTSAVNFAVMLAQQGQRVLLIDSDLRRPSLHRALDLLREPGLTNLLLGDADARETVRPNVLPNLDFLPSGPFPPNPSELLNSKTMIRIIEEFEGRYDHIIIDSPPVLAVTDAAILAVHTDGAVVVLRSGETEQRAAERAVDQLKRLGVRVFGAVLNEVSTASPDESYYLQYYYAYTPSGSPVLSGWQRLREGMSKVRFFG